MRPHGPDEVRRHITDKWRADEEVNPRDWSRAARRTVSQAETNDAVLGTLGRSFDAWHLFLQPEQHRLATGDFKGSEKVTGGPGTGKAVVALHRVRHLVDRLPPGHSRPVLLTTYQGLGQRVAGGIAQRNFTGPTFRWATVLCLYRA